MGEIIAFPIEQLAPEVEVIEVPKKEAPKKRAKRRVSKRKQKDVVVFNCAGHLTIGAGIALVAAHSPAEAVLILFGSLLPDIDHPTSTLGKWNPFTRWMTHRGHCHSLIGAALLCAPLLLVSTQFFLLMYLGALGHLIGDKVLSIMPRKKKFSFKLW